MEYKKGFIPLTPQELKIIAHVASGKANRDIATVTELAEKTVKNHLHNIFKCLEVESRVEMLLISLKLGVLVVDEGRNLVLSERYEARANGV